MNKIEKKHERHKKYQLIEQFDTFSKVLDLTSETTHICFKLDDHQIGDEFYLYEHSREKREYNTDRIFFNYSVLNDCSAGQTYTFDIVEERNGLLFVSNNNLLRHMVPSSFKDTLNQEKIDLKVERLNLEFNKVFFIRKPEERLEVSENLDDFKENVNYEFELKRTFLNKSNNQVLIVGYENKNYFLHTPSHLSHVKFKSPVITNIGTNDDGTGRYLRLPRKYISEMLYKVGRQYKFTIVDQIANYHSGISYWVVVDKHGNKSRYFPEDDLSFDIEISRLSDGDEIKLIVQSIAENGHLKLISELKNWEEINYRVEDVFEAIGYANKEDEYFFKYTNVLGIQDEEINHAEGSFIEQYNDGNNLWVFSYLSFLDDEVYNDLEVGEFEKAKTLIDIYIKIEKWVLEGSDYLTNFSRFKIDGIIQKAEHKIVKLKAALTAIEIFMEGKDQQYIEKMNVSLVRSPYLNEEKKEVFKQFLNISQFFRGETDFEELSNTIFLLLERNLILEEDRWIFINSISSFVYRIKKRINELLLNDVIVEKSKELQLLITYYFLLVYMYIIDDKKFKACMTSVNLLRNLSIYYNKVEYLNLAIDLIINKGYIQPSIIRHKNIFELDHNQLKKMIVYNNKQDMTFLNSGNIMSINGSFSIIPKNLYSGIMESKLKTIAKLGVLDLYVKSHFDLETIDENEKKEEIIEKAIQTIKHNQRKGEYKVNFQSYKELGISLEKIYTGRIKSIQPKGSYCIVSFVIDDTVIETLLHINTFHKNKLAGPMTGYIKIGDTVKFKVTSVDEDRVTISSADLIDDYAQIVLDEYKDHYCKILHRYKYNSKAITTEGLPVIITGNSYEEGEVVKMKIDGYVDNSQLYLSEYNELYNEEIPEIDIATQYRKHLIATSMLTPANEEDSFNNKIITAIKSSGHIEINDNSNNLKILTTILIHTLEHRLNFISEPEEIALNYFFIITLSGIMRQSKSYEYSNKLNNMARIVNLELSKDIELLSTVLDEEFVNDHENLQNLKEENSALKMLEYMNSDLLELPVNVDSSSPQYKLKKLIESVNLVKSYQLDDKLTEAIKKLIVHELYNTLKVSHNSIKELQSILSDEYETEKEQKPKRVVTNLGAESKYKEFKSSLFYSASDEPQRDVILRTICGFLNSYEGVGMLYIGVDDDGEIKGLKDDLRYKEHINNLDKYLNHLQSLIAEGFPKEINALLDYQFHKSNNLNYLEISIPSHNRPIAYKDEFYQRQGVQTRILKGEDITDFIVRKTSITTSIITPASSQLTTPSSTPKKDITYLVKSEVEEVIEYDLAEKSEVDNLLKTSSSKDLIDIGDFKPTTYDLESDNLLGYFYILKDTKYFRYMLSSTKLKDYEIEVAITEKYKFGHLLFCYDNACVNKVDVRNIINKSFNTIYMNALSNQGNLISIIKSLPNEELGIETKKRNKNYLKLYDINNISEHKVIGLKGNCIIEEDFDEVVAYFLASSLLEGFEIFKSDTSKGCGKEVKKGTYEYKLLKELSL